MSSNTGTNKFPSNVLPTIALASTACALLVQNHHRVGHVPAIFKRIFGRFGEKKTKKTKEKETPFDENETIKTPSSNDEKDDDALIFSLILPPFLSRVRCARHLSLLLLLLFAFFKATTKE